MSKYDLRDAPITTPEEHTEIAKAFCEKLFSDQDMVKKLQASKVVARFVYFDEAVWGPGVTVDLTIDCSKDPIEILTGPCDLEPDLEIEESRMTGHIYWMGKLNFMTAITRGLIKVKGSIRTAMRLVPIIKPGFAYYRETLQELGRDDLLGFPPD